MNTEIPNNETVPGSTPVSAVNPPVTDTPVTPVETPVVTEPVAPAAPAPVAEPVAPAMPAEPAPAPAEAQGFNAAPESTTPTVDLGTMAAPAVPEAPAQEPVAPTPEVAPAAPVVDVPAMPADPIAPAAPEAPMQSAPVMEAAPEAPVTPAAPVVPGVGSETQPAVMPDAQPAPAPAAEEKPKKKGGAKLLIIIVAILLIVLVGGYFVYTKVLVTPEKTYDTVVKTLMKEAREKLTDNKFSKMMLDTSKPYVIDGEVVIQTSMEELEFLNNYKADFSLGADYKNNKLMLSAGLIEKSDKLVEGAFYVTDNKIYLDLKDLYDKVIEAGEFDVDLSTLADTGSNEDVEVLFNAVENAILEGIKAGKLTSSDVKKDVFGKSVSVTDNLYTVDKDNSAVVIKAIIKSLRDDDKAISVIADFAQVEKTEITKALDEVLASDTLAADDEVNIKVHLYTGGLLKDTLYGIDIEADDKTYYSYLVDGDRSATVLDLGEAKITSDKKGNVNTIKAIVEEQEISIVITQSTNSINVKVTVDSTSIEFDMKDETTNNGFKENINIKLSDSSLGVDFGLVVTLDCKQEAYEDIKVADAVSYLELTDTDMSQILTNLSTKLEGSELGALLTAELQNFMGGESDIGYGGSSLADDALDLATAAQIAFQAQLLKGANAEWKSTDNVCLSMDYLCENGYFGGDACDDSWYNGSVLVNGSTNKYNIWITDGFDAYENVDSTLIDSYTPVSKYDVTTTCNGLGTITK